MKMDVIILAGGLGTRLRSVIQDIPKPMAPVNGKPFLHIVLESLPLDRIRSIVLSVGYKHESIKESVGEFYHSIPVKYAVENEPLGTGGGVKLAMAMCDAETILLLNGDTFFELDFNELVAQHLENDNDLTVALKLMEDPYRYGAVEIDQKNRIVGFKEKNPHLKQALINGGVYVLNRRLKDVFPSEDKCSFEQDILEKHVGDLTFGSYVSEGMFIDIGIPEDYQRAHELF